MIVIVYNKLIKVFILSGMLIYGLLKVWWFVGFFVEWFCFWDWSFGIVVLCCVFGKDIINFYSFFFYLVV